MEYFLQKELQENKKFKKYFDENTNYVKYLNRNPDYQRVFMKEMKEKYRERTSDKLNDALNTIDIVSSLLETFK